jgi:hypothetical protein
VASREREIEVGCGGRGCGSKPELRRGIKEFENEKRRVQEELRMWRQEFNKSWRMGREEFEKSSRRVDNVKRRVQEQLRMGREEWVLGELENGGCFLAFGAWSECIAVVEFFVWKF